MKHSVKYSISFFASRRFSEGQNGDITDLCAIIEKVSTPFTNTVSGVLTLGSSSLCGYEFLSISTEVSLKVPLFTPVFLSLLSLNH